MEKRDLRSLGRETQEIPFASGRCSWCSNCHKTQAEAPPEVVGVSRQIVNQWMRNYACEGEKALLDRRLNTIARVRADLTDGFQRVRGLDQGQMRPEQ